MTNQFKELDVYVIEVRGKTKYGIQLYHQVLSEEPTKEDIINAIKSFFNICDIDPISINDIEDCIEVTVKKTKAKIKIAYKT